MQTFGDFEVLIMDDCSPDNTPEVARSFSDARVIHIRNEVNLGHLRNYNKGIELARGEYVWQISADDHLRKPYILERYLSVMDKHPEAGYAICPAVTLYSGRETQVVRHSVLSQEDLILNGRRFLYTLLTHNPVLVPACMVRKECFHKVSMFPLDLPFAGDWYLWCIFALYYDVIYFAEPMVNYREHEMSMTNSLIRSDYRVLSQDDLAVRWRMKDKLWALGYDAMARHCEDIIAKEYVRYLSQGYKASDCKMGWEDFERSLDIHGKDGKDRGEIRRRVLVGYGDAAYWQREFKESMNSYGRAMREGPVGLELWIKMLLSRLGRAGWIARRALGKLIQISRRIRVSYRTVFEGRCGVPMKQPVRAIAL